MTTKLLEVDDLSVTFHTPRGLCAVRRGLVLR